MTKAYRCILITAVIYSVIIGAIYVTLSVLGLMARMCEFNMNESPLIYMLYLLYFRVSDCKNYIRWSHLDIIAEPETLILIPNETEATARTFIFCIAYLGLYSALIFTAIFSLCGIKNSCLGRASFPIFFVPWIIVSVSIVVLDVLATVFYVMDSVQVTSTDGLMELLEIPNPNAVRSIFETLGVQWRVLPPIIMFLVTSKGFIFLIFDIVFISLVTKAGWSVSSYHKYVHESSRQYNNNMSRTNPAFEDPQTDTIAQKQHERQMGYVTEQASIQEVQASSAGTAPPETPQRYNDTSIQAFAYPANSYQKEMRQRSPPPNSAPNQNQAHVRRPNSLAVSAKYPERSASPRPDFDNVDREIESRLSSYSESNGHVIRTVEPLKDIPEYSHEDIPEQQQQHIRVRVLPTIAPVLRSHSETKQKPKVPPKPPNRHSMAPFDERQERRNSIGKVERTSSSVHAPEELRGQLPWSYFKPRDDVPKKVLQELRSDEPIPYNTPVPDYTLHFQKDTRPKLIDADGSWTRYK